MYSNIYHLDHSGVYEVIYEATESCYHVEGTRVTILTRVSVHAHSISLTGSFVPRSYVCFPPLWSWSTCSTV